MHYDKRIDEKIALHTYAIIALLGLDPRKYKANISIISKEPVQKFQELKR